MYVLVDRRKFGQVFLKERSHFIILSEIFVTCGRLLLKSRKLTGDLLAVHVNFSWNNSKKFTSTKHSTSPQDIIIIIIKLTTKSTKNRRRAFAISFGATAIGAKEGVEHFRLSRARSIARRWPLSRRFCSWPSCFPCPAAPRRGEKQPPSFLALSYPFVASLIRCRHARAVLLDSDIFRRSVSPSASAPRYLWFGF